jgi:zinc transport system substrate-binding protein
VRRRDEQRAVWTRAAARLWALAALAFPLGAGCRAATHAPARPVVAVSVIPQAWLVERLAGDRVEVVVMIPPGARPDGYEPELAQLRALSRASLYLKVGHPHFAFEVAWTDRLLAERPDLLVVDQAQGAADHEHDPHLWVSPRRTAAVVGPLALALARVVPAGAAQVRERADSLRAEIEATDAKLREILAPARGRAFVVLHPAWGQLAEDYGLVQLSILHEHKEPDARHLADLIARARELGVRVVFAQPQFDDTPARVVADEIGARVEQIDPLAPDWSDNLERVARRIAAEARG